MRLVAWKLRGMKTVLTVEHTSWWWWLGVPAYRVQYQGSGTVWHRLPDFERCGTFTEAVLADFWEYARNQPSLPEKPR